MQALQNNEYVKGTVAKDSATFMISNEVVQSDQPLLNISLPSGEYVAQLNWCSDFISPTTGAVTNAYQPVLKATTDIFYNQCCYQPRIYNSLTFMSPREGRKSKVSAGDSVFFNYLGDDQSIPNNRVQLSGNGAYFEIINLSIFNEEYTEGVRINAKFEGCGDRQKQQGNGYIFITINYQNTI